MRVLIAEDDSLSFKLLQHLLEPYASSVERAENGKEALEMFKKNFNNKTPYDLVFMDVMMPKCDGVEALMLIRLFEKNNGVLPENEIRTILTTAMVNKKLILKAIMLGRIIGYLAKPLDIEKFTLLVKECQAGSTGKKGVI